MGAVGEMEIAVIVGIVFEIVSADELFATMEIVQLFALAVCSHTIESETLKLPGVRVDAVCDDITTPFLNHLHVLADTFSESVSESNQVPLLQVRVEDVLAGLGEIVGALSVGRWSG